MRLPLALGLAALLLAACSSTPPPADWKRDAANQIARYQKHALAGENTVAERQFKLALGATQGAGRIEDTARLWLVRCAVRRAMLIDDPCAEFSALADSAQLTEDRAYHRFLMLDWQGLDARQLPTQYRDLLAAAPEGRPARVAAIRDPFSRLLAASLLVRRGEATTDTLALAAETASERGWKQPLLVYLRRLESDPALQQDAHRLARVRTRIGLVESALGLTDTARKTP